ncbi:MAG: hypothetical protein GF364_00540 [Candidatus Lokiarchaeota archaeon]|nr:hypothetical protein [Candidatus Lokiarchaeota archaeon]
MSGYKLCKRCGGLWVDFAANGDSALCIKCREELEKKLDNIDSLTIGIIDLPINPSNKT